MINFLSFFCCFFWLSCQNIPPPEQEKLFVWYQDEIAIAVRLKDFCEDTWFIQPPFSDFKIIDYHQVKFYAYFPDPPQD